MKHKFKLAECELLRFASRDIVTDSDEDPFGPGGGPGGGGTGGNGQAVGGGDELSFNNPFLD